jgi:hypothetical protein
MPDVAEITKGLTAGEQVVTSDRSALKGGELVQPKQTKPIAYGASGGQ